MKHLKPFKVFEELDTDAKTDNKMRQNSSKFVEMAKKYEVRLRTPEGKVNKGWAGHVCERHLGLPLKG